MDDDLGYGVLRVSRDQEWKPSYLLAPLRAVLLSMVFEWGIALHDLYAEQEHQQTEEAKAELKRAMIRKMVRQAGKDYLFFPALNGRRFLRTFLANLVANGFRNGWAYIVIVCGHFADGAEKFTPAAVENETKPEWYLRSVNRTSRGPGPEGHERKPLLPNRAPPVPRSAQQQVPRDRGASSGNPG
jgi:fatty acid desaturase